MTNPALIVETALLLLAAYLLGCLLGYAARRIVHAGRATRQVMAAAQTTTAPPVPPEPRRVPSVAARLAASVEEMPPPATPVATQPKLPDPKPQVLAAPRNGMADNLRQIKGVGPKIEASLHGMGVFHIDQIAGWSEANIDWVESRLAFRGRVRRERWVEQAMAIGQAGMNA